MSGTKSVITQIRFEPALLQKIAEASRRTGLSKADIMRLAMETGLEDLKRVDFDLPHLISTAAHAGPGVSYRPPPPTERVRVADSDELLD